jgi:hypothetical protein
MQIIASPGRGNTGNPLRNVWTKIFLYGKKNAGEESSGFSLSKKFGRCGKFMKWRREAL